MKRIKVIGLLALVLVAVWMFFFKGGKPSSKVRQIAFSDEKVDADLQFLYSDTLDNDYLRILREKYDLEALTENLPYEGEKIKAVLDWAHNQWEHNGGNEPSSPDALTILKEAREGNKYRCVEYGIVLAAGLNSIGIHSRVLGLRTSDCATVKSGAGHVAAEAYSSELKKWIFIDGQFNVMPVLHGTPLNAIEFQEAIVNQDADLKIVNKNGELPEKEQKNYIEWIGKYLFYFLVPFDNRYGFDVDKLQIEGKEKLMSVPLKAENNTVFQKKFKANYCLYTNNKNDFYQAPN